jgi:hypothetical protein
MGLLLPLPLKQSVPPTYITEQNFAKEVRQKMMDSVDGLKLVLYISI